MVTHQGAQEPKTSRGIRGWLTDRLARYMSEPVDHYDLRGRNDIDKVGYSIVCVHEHGDVCHSRRTGGETPHRFPTLSAWRYVISASSLREMAQFRG